MKSKFLSCLVLASLSLPRVAIAQQSSTDAVPAVAGLPPAARAAAASIDPEKMRAHVRFLSLDLLEGRGPGTRGDKLAAEYIATQFALNGVEPSDEYHADWDFRGNAKMARFGFVLGWLASDQPHSIEWQANDEFEKPRKASEKN